MPYLEPQTTADKQVWEYLDIISKLRERQKPTEFLFSGVESFLLRHGHFFTSAALPPTVKPMRPSQCYENAFRVARRTAAFHYVEGVAIGMVPMDHAWLVDKDGNVVDPTWTLERSGVSYYGVEFDLDEVKLSRRGGCLSLLNDYPRDFPALRGVNVVAKNAWFRR